MHEKGPGPAQKGGRPDGAVCRTAAVSAAWNQACSDSVMLSAHLSGVIINSLDTLGRETSLTGLPGDWNEETCRRDWSHQLAAFVAGMGDFGIACALYTAAGFGGRFGSVITEFPMEPSKLWTKEELADPNRICEEILEAWQYRGEACEFQTFRGKISACPAGAIAEAGVDRKKCQDYCRLQDQPAPAPEVCAKCWYEN